MKKGLLIFNKTFDKNEIKQLINWFLNNYGSIRATKLLDNLKDLGFNYATKAGISIGLEDLKVPKIRTNLYKNTQKKLQELDKNFEKGKVKLPDKLGKITELWNTTNDILKNEVISNYRQTDLLNPVYMMTFSGARGNISQIKQLVGMRGLMSDSQGQIISLPIKSNLKEGMNITEYFISCYGARKGLVDTALKTANSGYLTRRLIYVSQNQIIKQPNCKTVNGIKIIANKNTKKDIGRLKEKILGRVLAKSVIGKHNGKKIASEGQDICNYIAKKILKENKTIIVRSPLTCQLNTGICQLCYGWNLGNGRMIELGESVGIIAAQSIGEPGTQLTMRTFHTGGIFAGEVEENILAPHNGIIFYEANKKGLQIETRYREKAFFTLKEKKITLTENNINSSTIVIPKFNIIYDKPNNRIFAKQIISENYDFKSKINKTNFKLNESQDIKNKISGQVYFKEIKQTKNYNKKTRLWILSGNIFTFEKMFKFLNNVKLDIITKNEKILKKNKKYTIKKKTNINYINIIKNYKYNEKNVAKTGKKIHNIYLINKYEKRFLLNNRKNEKYLFKKEGLNKIGTYITKGQIVENTKQVLKLRKTSFYQISKDSQIYLTNNCLIKKGNVLFQTYYKEKRTEDIVQGLPRIEELLEAKKTTNIKTITSNSHEKLKKLYINYSKNNSNSISVIKSINYIQKYLINKIQKVYQSQGVKISDKHLEIIIKQMTSKVLIVEKGDSNLITGEVIELNRAEKINRSLKNKIIYEPILIGISKLSLTNQSFISEASFQETTRILAKSAIEGKVDWLYGLKENLVLGNLIPAGSGFKCLK